ncbi:Hypothetical predicted protein [Mytilus galloprovincialis]|uniref:DZIP3-like HEPN domain-containing protein n=1 Tax=Mytilus galloprovincialis TaxID=29158 RepID=A0A8B6D5E3_MYTGA|nr:Hypothetical predicted protein [Mytilus galloprovincialis]
MGDKDQDNYVRNLVVIANYGKEALACLLEYEVTSKHLSLEDFVNSNQHDIYHLCFNKKKCCQCVQGWKACVPTNRVLRESQLEIVLNKNISRYPCHKTKNVSDFCCCQALHNLTTERFDVTLLRCFLTNFGTLWKVAPVEQAVNTILRHRNDYGHASDTRISEGLFQQHKAEIENAILDIFSFCRPSAVLSMKQKLSDSYCRSLDTVSCSKYLSVLLEEIHLQSSLENMEKVCSKLY